MPIMQDALRVSGRKHDIVGIKLYDKMDWVLPKARAIAH